MALIQKLIQTDSDSNVDLNVDLNVELNIEHIEFSESVGLNKLECTLWCELSLLCFRPA